MAYTLWSQDIFSKGELSPFMYGRCTVNEYNNGLKTAQNVLTYPTGAAGKRFGTIYQATLSGLTAFNQLYFQTFQYLNECVYQLVFTPLLISIYLEGILVATVVTTLSALDVYNQNTTTLGALFRVTGAGFKPYDLARSPNSSAVITSVSTNSFASSAAPFVANKVYPVRFTVTGGTMMQTNPQIVAGVTYFVATQSASTAVLFSTPEEAKDYILTGDLTNAYAITSIGTGTTRVIVQNTWTFNHSFFKNLPVYDFNGSVTSYDAITFTPSATTGAGVTITLSAPYAPLNSSYIGGAFIGAGGTSRITAVADTSHFTVSVQEPFDSTSAIQGSLTFLAEPAWSDARGWPQVCSSYQNRALFANTASLPNGFYASVINDYSDFGDLTADDDDAISWYPTSDNMNFIRFIIPYRSITVHTNTGIYSSPLSDIAAITPSNFTLQLQDSTPATVLQPQAIDNQILVLSGNDAHQMLWDGINNAYTSGIISVINEQTIRDPVDETAYVDLRRAGSRYVFIINSNGSMAIFQTLISQGVSGFTPHIMEQSYGSASFLQVASSSTGRAWFVVQRQIAVYNDTFNILGVNDEELEVVGPFPYTLDVPIAITFTSLAPNILPETTTVTLTETNYYYAVPTTTTTFKLYLTIEDANAELNALVFVNPGNGGRINFWPLSTIFTMEELTHDTYLDCAVYYNGTPTSTVTTGALFNAQDIKMVGDGFGFDSPGSDNFNNVVNFVAHGVATDVSVAYIGFPINTLMEPMPLNISSGPSAKETTLTQPKHIRWARFMFNNTIGGTINGIPIALEPFDQAHIGEPPIPARGIFEMSIMKGWDDFKNPSFTIEHNEPFDIQLLGVFYSVDI